MTDGDEFARVVRLGLGRALTFLRTHDPGPYAGAVLEACLNDWRFEADEPTRERYLLELIRAAGIEVIAREQILSAMAVVDEDTDIEQIAALTRLLAQEGDAGAGQVLIDTFVRLPYDEDLPTEILALNGLDGLVLIARTHGALLRAGEGVQEIDGDLLKTDWMAEHRFGQAAVVEALDRESGDPDVRTYVDHLRRRKEEAATSPRQQVEREAVLNLPYKEFRSWIVDLTPRRSRFSTQPWCEWGRRTSEGDLMRAAQDLLALSDDDHDLLSQYLRIFGERAFPLDPDRLIALARRGRLDQPWEFSEAAIDDRLAMFALRALGNVRHPDVRALAFELGERSRWTSEAANLVVANFQEGDLATLVELFDREYDMSERHGIGFAIRDLFDTIRPPGIEQALLHYYEFGPCARCREFIVHTLLNDNLLPEIILEECRFDANPRTREVIVEYDARNRTSGSTSPTVAAG